MERHSLTVVGLFRAARVSKLSSDSTESKSPLWKNQASAIASRPTGGSAADQGVRPTMFRPYLQGSLKGVS